MSDSEFTTEILLGEDEFAATVEYTVMGRYMPQTRIDPAEYPELEIIAVKIDRDGKTVDVAGSLSPAELEHIEELAWERAKSEAADWKAEWDYDESLDRREA